MSDEEKCRKKQKIEDNRRRRAISQSLSTLSTVSHSPSIVLNDEQTFQYVPSTLNETFDDDSNDYKYLVDDYQRHFITTIEEHYRKAVRLNVSIIQACNPPCVRPLNGMIDVLNEPMHISALRLITYFKLTPEFNVGDLIMKRTNSKKPSSSMCILTMFDID
jgi:hypothetical protein